MSLCNPPVTLRSSGRIAEIRFNRPENLNALGLDVAQGFREAVAHAVADASVHVIVLAAEGRAFVAGGDLASFRDADEKTAVAHQLIDPLHEALLLLADARQIVLASLKGAVAGAGMSIALAADLAIAADDVKLNLAYQRIAASPDCGGSWSLPRLVGLRKALEISLLSETIEAAEALRLGLVNRIVPLSGLEEETAALARRLANGPPAAQAHIKALMRRSLDRTFAEQLDAERESFGICAAAEEFREAISAFFEKRRAVYSAE